jgi:N-acetylmuramoyl-L-alanine amidase
MKFFLLGFMCILVIGGAFYGGIYIEKKHQKSVQAIILNKKEATKAAAKAKEVSDTKIRDEAIAKYKEGVASTTSIEKNKKSSNSRSQKIVVIDPGHSSIVNLATEPEAPDSKIMKIMEPGGGHGIITKTPEYVVNMAVAVKLRSLLQEKGYTVIMTKTQNSQMLGNIARAEVGNKAHADLVIRIHADGNNNSAVKGASMLVPANTINTSPIYKSSKRYGQIVFNSLIKTVGMSNRGVNERSDMTGFNWSKVPVILVETGFLSNVSEEKLLKTDSYLDKIAKGLGDGIEQAMK